MCFARAAHTVQTRAGIVSAFVCREYLSLSSRLSVFFTIIALNLGIHFSAPKPVQEEYYSEIPSFSVVVNLIRMKYK